MPACLAGQSRGGGWVSQHALQVRSRGGRSGPRGTGTVWSWWGLVSGEGGSGPGGSPIFQGVSNFFGGGGGLQFFSGVSPIFQGEGVEGGGWGVEGGG